MKSFNCTFQGTTGKFNRSIRAIDEKNARAKAKVFCETYLVTLIHFSESK